MIKYVPIMLNCENQSCIVVGGGSIAERKVAPLLENGAKVTVISPEVTPFLRSAHHKGEMNWLERPYRKGDLDRAFLVYAATNQGDINKGIARDANLLGIPVNVCHESGIGDFITPSILRRGDLVIAVSTSGAGPLLAREIIHELEAQYGNEYEIYIDFLSEMRAMVKRKVTDADRRRRLLKSLMEIDLLDQIRKGQFRAWTEDEISSWIEKIY